MWRAAVYLFLIPAYALVASAGGCKHHEEAPVIEPGVTRSQLLADGERLMRDGQALRRQGLDRRQAGAGGEDFIIRGEGMIADGERLKDRAMMMK